MSMVKSVFIAIILCLFCSTFARSSDSDALVTSPLRFKLLLENNQVRVLEYELKPGEKDSWHVHPPKVSYVAIGGRLRIHLADGTSFETDEKEGTATWMDDLPKHYAENIGSTPVKIILVEVKAANTKK